MPVQGPFSLLIPALWPQGVHQHPTPQPKSSALLFLRGSKWGPDWLLVPLAFPGGLSCWASPQHIPLLLGEPRRLWGPAAAPLVGWRGKGHQGLSGASGLGVAVLRTCGGRRGAEEGTDSPSAAPSSDSPFGGQHTCQVVVVVGIPKLTLSLVGSLGARGSQAPPGPLPLRLVLSPGPGRPCWAAQGHSQGLGWLPRGQRGWRLGG